MSEFQPSYIMPCAAECPFVKNGNYPCAEMFDEGKAECVAGVKNIAKNCSNGSRAVTMVMGSDIEIGVRNHEVEDILGYDTLTFITDGMVYEAVAVE